MRGAIIITATIWIMHIIIVLATCIIVGTVIR